MEHFGSYLKTHREKRGIRLEEIASITKIHLHSLEVLEASQWEQLPPEPFIRGFIIAYAKYVGLEPRDVLERYFEATGKKKVAAEEENAPTPIPAAAREKPNDLIEQKPLASPQKILTAAAVFAVVMVAVVLIYVGRRADHGAASNGGPAPASLSTSQENLPPPENAVPAPSDTSPRNLMDAAKAQGSAAPAPTPAVVTTPAPATAPTTTAQLPNSPLVPAEMIKHELTVESGEKTWMKVVIDERAPFRHFLMPGEKVVFKAHEKMKVVMGNATGAHVLYNGQPTQGALYTGTIRYFKYPLAARFPQDQPSPQRQISSEGEKSPALEALRNMPAAVSADE